MHRSRTSAIAGVALALAALTGLTACGSDGAAKADAAPIRAAGGSGGDTTGVRVAGRGKVEGTPNVMTVSMGVQTVDGSAQAALDRNNERAAALIKSLKQGGVAEKDIQTSELNVSPNYNDKGQITGYSVANMVTAKLRNLDKAGAVIDAAAAKAGDDIRLNGVAFSIDDTSQLVADARAKAVKDAVDHANQLAAAAGVELGGIRTIDDTNTDIPQPYQYLQFAEARAAADSVPIERGTQELSVDVLVVFDLG